VADSPFQLVHISTRDVDEYVRARDQFEAWDTLKDRPVEDFGIVTTAELNESSDPIPIRTAALLFSWCRDEDALRLIEVAMANDLPDTELVDRETGARIAARRCGWDYD
jgi:hypothetical protein